jgi:hypothetical protein
MSLLNQLKKEANDMNFKDFLYYKLKDLNQQYDFWNEKARYKVRGAKVKARNIKHLTHEVQQIFIATPYEVQNND